MTTMRKVSRLTCYLSLSTLLTIFVLSAGQARAFEKLSEAQSWIYDRSHLANTSQDQVLSYVYAAIDDASAIVSDEASLSITGTHEDGRRDVEIDFLSDERHIALPAFPGYRGNPVIIAMLEHIAQSISSQTGGGALYFRNRIRDALASENVELVKQTISYNDSELDATRLTFSPFTSDQYLGGNELMRQTQFNIDLSDDVPGGVFRIQAASSHDDQRFERTLSLN